MTTNLDHSDPEFEKLQAPYLKLYSVSTCNGDKITILLSLLGLKYHHRTIQVLSNPVQHEPWFKAMNPHSKIPLLSDVDSTGKQTLIAESDAILLYLSEKYDKDHKYYYGMDNKLYWEQLQWVMFEAASYSLNQYGAMVFSSATEECEFAINYYKNTTERVLTVLETRLKENNGWLVGDHLNIADIAAYPWVKALDRAGIDIEKFPILKEWAEKVGRIPQVSAGTGVAPLVKPSK